MLTPLILNISPNKEDVNKSLSNRQTCTDKKKNKVTRIIEIPLTPC